MDTVIIKQGMDDLAGRDPHVAAGLDLVGYPEPRIRPHGFHALMRIIAGQQVSVHAAAAIIGRVEALMPDVTAEAFLELEEDALRGAGLSRRKVEYAQGLARAVVGGDLHLDRFPEMADEEIIAELSSLRGIGRWTAEIYAMFSLGRTDIFPADDLALQEGLKRLKKLDERPKPRAARLLVEDWAPWRSVGSLFLWHYYKGAPE